MRNNYPDWFDAIWAMYPKRIGGNPKIAAWKAAQSRLKAGYSIEDMTEGVRRYKRFCDATGKTGTEYIKHGATFLGPNEWFLEEWDPPKKRLRVPSDDDEMVEFAERELGIKPGYLETYQKLRRRVYDALEARRVQ